MSFTWDKLQLKHKMVVIASAITILTVFFTFFIWRPQHERIVALTEEFNAEQQQVRVLENFALSHPDANKYLNELDSKRTRVDNLLPNDANISSFLIMLEQNAKASGVRLEQVQPSQAVNKNGYREIPVSMSIKGNYFQLLDFLQRMEGSQQRFNSTGSMAITNKSGSLESKMTVIVYAYGVAPVSTAAGQGHTQGNSKN